MITKSIMLAGIMFPAILLSQPSQIDGSLGVGADPGSYKVKIRHSTFGINFENVTTLDDWEFWTNSGGLSIYSNGNFRGNFDPNTGAYSSISDARVKTDIRNMPPVLQKIHSLRPYVYQLIDAKTSRKSANPSYGFLAQDVLRVFPHLVTYHKDQNRQLDSYTLDYSGFGVIAIKAIQELQEQVAFLERRLVQLEDLLQSETKKGQ